MYEAFCLSFFIKKTNSSSNSTLPADLFIDSQKQEFCRILQKIHIIGTHMFL